MASIEALSLAQNAALANVTVGTLILVHKPEAPAHVGDRESEYEEDSQGGDEEDEDEDEEDEDEEDGGDGEVASQGSEPAPQDLPQPASTNPAIEPITRVANDPTGADRAEHIEDVGLSDSVANDSIERELSILGHARAVAMVTQVDKDSSGRTTEVHIAFLLYRARPEVGLPSYQMYGNQCVANVPPKPAAGYDTVQCLVSIFGIVPEVTFIVAPGADQVRAILYDGMCVAGCNQGFLASIDQLHGMVKDYTVPTSNTDVHAICPACIGVDLMKEHQSLHAELENFLRVANFESVLDFHGRLSQRRQALGYEYEQFDEREWNFLFDDMLSEGDDGERSQGGLENWDDANDPNGDVVPRPATQAAIDSLQTMKYATVKVDDDAQCTVCCEQFKDEQLVVRLPCNHIFCKGECILEWLKNNDSCPLCRAKVSGEAADSDNEDEEEELPDVDEAPEKEQTEADVSTPGAYAV